MSNFSFHNKEKRSISQSLNPICRFEYITLEGIKTIQNQINKSRNLKDPLLEAAKIGVYIETLSQTLLEFGFQYQKNEENGQYTIFDNNKNKEKRCVIHDNLDDGQRYDEPVAVSLDELENDGNGNYYDFEDAEIYDAEILTKRGQHNIERVDALWEKHRGQKSREIEAETACQAETIEEVVELCNGYAIGHEYYNYL
ncbi:19594_t:CDS:1 [Dentiscutata erythropus]|uniref:19594_t:CDS:1 n=1 Tax=Dentiscutata erythropus TaxID=1348616 RepID=A0A9N9DN09_9GLOM|nr:19594_t:CDS:1 [Dentiscutata erythropus]